MSGPSPIETALFEALSEHIDHGALQGEHVLVWPALYVSGKPEVQGWALLDEAGDRYQADKPTVFVARQARIRGYFADILLWSPHLALALAIECDGHDFHERSKQQAMADRARDRELLRHGVSTIRFTGSEIYREANQCALEVIETWRAVEMRLDNTVEQTRADAMGDGMRAADGLHRYHAQDRELAKGPAWLRALVFPGPGKGSL